MKMIKTRNISMAKGRMTEKNRSRANFKFQMSNVNSMTNFKECKVIKVKMVTLGNEGEDDEVNFRDRSDKSLVMFCSGIRDLDDDLRKISKCDVEEAVSIGMGKCEMYEE